jgi:hypothetical protein
MCWNQAVSLNTFLFSGFVLGLVAYNNAYTQYKIESVNNIWVYFFILSIILVQLVEFFIWRNVNHPFYNRVFTWAANIIILSQPIFSMILIANNKIKTYLIPVYLCILIPYLIYQITFFDVHSEIGKSGHLSWILANFGKYGNFIPWIIWLFFFSFSFIYSGKYIFYIFIILLLAMSYYNYKQDQSIGSMWCWFSNSIAIYFAFYLLFYLPFIQGNKGISILKFC